MANPTSAVTREGRAQLRQYVPHPAAVTHRYNLQADATRITGIRLLQPVLITAVSVWSHGWQDPGPIALADDTTGGSRAAAPMHPHRLSEPMRWLTAGPGRVRMECTGFGLNLVSGNYEFACLVVIEDDEFWPRHGGDVEANWESAGLRLYSSLDDQLVSKLIADESWSNEGLFAFLQGIRRLREIGGERVNLPSSS